MDFKQLHTFAVVAKEQNFSRAAELLNYSQSTVSEHIHALERELGVPLFDRLGRGVLLTEAGKRILVHVENLSGIEQQIRSIALGCDEPCGTLVIGAPESIIAYRLPRVLVEFRKRFPKVELKFQLGTCAELRSSLEVGAVDIALLIEAPVAADNLITEGLINEQIVLVSAPSHPLAEMDAIEAADLTGEVLLMVESTRGGWSYREIFENEMVQTDVRPSQWLEFSSVEAIKQCAISGVGIALLPEITVRHEIADKKLKICGWPSIQIPTQMAWNKHRWISSAMQSFMRVVKEIDMAP